MYKKQLLFLESTHCTKLIHYSLNFFDEVATQTLMKAFYANTAKALFRAITDNLLLESEEQTFWPKIHEFCEMRRIDWEFLDGFYVYNKEKCDFQSHVLRHFRRYKNFKSDEGATGIMPSGNNLKTTRNSCVLCNFIGPYATRGQIVLYRYKECLFYVRKGYYRDHIWCEIVGLGASEVKKLMSLWRVENNRQLFSAFKHTFIHQGREQDSWVDFMEFCDINCIAKERMNKSYYYNTGNLTFSQFLRKEFNSSATVFISKR